MDPQEIVPTAHSSAPGFPDEFPAEPRAEHSADSPAGGRALYLPFGGTDPDFYFPADHERRSGGISRWFRALPVFGRKRS